MSDRATRSTLGRPSASWWCRLACVSALAACADPTPAPTCGLTVERVLYLDSSGLETPQQETHPVPSIRFTFSRDIVRSTITDSSVVLRDAQGTSIPVHGNSANFPNSATITPRERLEVSGAYTLRLGPGIFASDGCALTPHEARFVVRDEPLPPAAYTGGALSIPGGVSSPTSLAVGPDGRLFVAQHNGTIVVVTLDAQKSVTATLRLKSLLGRSLLGILVAGTAVDPVIWASHSEPNTTGGPDPALDPAGGVISRLTGPDFEVREDVIVGLPRSAELHQNNGIAFEPGSTRLFITVGGNTNFGAPSSKLGERGETLLSGSIVVVDVALIDALPLDVRPMGEGGTYPITAADPWFTRGALTETTPLRVFATGFRNPYDLVWTRASQQPRLYATDNGANSGWGKTAGSEDGCPGQQPSDLGSHPDELNTVEPGRFYGHPNPARGECVYNGTGYVAPSLETGLNLSTNGIAEYDAPTIPGTGVERGDLLYVNYSSGDSLVRWRPSTGETSVLVQPLENPIDVAVEPDGTIYVAEFGSTAGSAQLGQSRVSYYVPR